MARAYASTILPAPVETVWSLIRDFNGLPSWVPAVADSTTQASMKTTTPTMAIVVYWRVRYAVAPSRMAPEISCMRALPALWPRIQLRCTKP